MEDSRVVFYVCHHLTCTPTLLMHSKLAFSNVLELGLVKTVSMSVPVSFLVATYLTKGK